MNIEPGEMLDRLRQIDDMEERLDVAEERIAALLADEFISAGVFRRGLTVFGYWLMGVCSVALVVWLITGAWRLM